MAIEGPTVEKPQAQAISNRLKPGPMYAKPSPPGQADFAPLVATEQTPLNLNFIHMSGVLTRRGRYTLLQGYNKPWQLAAG